MSTAAADITMAKSEKSQLKPVSTAMTFGLSGGAGCMSWCVVHPFDCMKTRMQLSKEMAKTSGLKPYSSVFDCFKTTIKEEGPRGLYSGLSAGLARQGTYSTMRLGFYQTFRTYWKDAGYKNSFLSMFFLGGCAGGISAFLTNPVEVALIRMQADGRLPVAERRGYTHVFNAIGRVASEEGVISLWNGVTPTVVRAIVVNSVQMATYDRTKQLLNAYGVDGFAGFFLASLNAGFLYSLATLPLDISKTRMQNQGHMDDKSKLPYRTIPQTVTKIAAEEGVFALWAGFLPYFARCGSHSIGMFLILEQLKNCAQHQFGYDFGRK